MSKRSDMWRRAQVCMSLARATDDPVLKERYEDLALDLARNAERDQTFAISKGRPHESALVQSRLIYCDAG